MLCNSIQLNVGIVASRLGLCPDKGVKRRSDETGHGTVSRRLPHRDIKTGGCGIDGGKRLQLSKTAAAAVVLARILFNSSITLIAKFHCV